MAKLFFEKIFGPPKMPYDVIRGVKTPKNEFFGPNSDIFQPISMKLGKPVKNEQTQILVYFGRI